MITVLLPDTLAQAIHAHPRKPKLIYWFQAPLIISAAILVSWVVFQRELNISLLIVVILMGALTYLYFIFFKKKADRQNSENLERYEYDKQNLWPFRRKEYFKALKALPNIDFSGSVCSTPQIGYGETKLKTALKDFHFTFSSTPAQKTFIHQYELTELNWGTWEDEQGGTKNYVADFAYFNPALNIKINIEIDGDSHDSETEKLRDEKRNDIFLSRGWVVLRIRDKRLIKDPPNFAHRLIRFIKALEEGDIISLTAYQDAI